VSHVFISYKTEDVDFAENVKSRLKEAGFTAWLDAEISAGEEWRTAIDRAMKDALALIVIMTPEAKVSEYVTYEWAFALGKGVKVIPVILRTTKLHPRLEVLQRLDFTNIKNRPWIKLIDETRAASPRTLTLYDSRNGYQLPDFRVEHWEGAKGTLDLASSPDAAKGALVFDRENTSGEFVAFLESYAYKDKPKVIPVGDSPGAARRFQISCEVRARQADHTLLVTVKVVGAPMGEHLAQWHHRITPEGWIDIDHDVEKPVSGNCQLRFQDRSVSAVPSRLEIRRLVVTEHEPPQSLLPLPLGDVHRRQPARTQGLGDQRFSRGETVPTSSTTPAVGKADASVVTRRRQAASASSSAPEPSHSPRFSQPGASARKQLADQAGLTDGAVSYLSPGIVPSG
jgi:hypothetical protein